MSTSYYFEIPLFDLPLSFPVPGPVLNNNDEQFCVHANFIEACTYGWLPAIELGIQSGTPVDATNLCGETGLMLACRFGLKECVKLLLRYGATVDLQSHHHHCVVKLKTYILYIICLLIHITTHIQNIYNIHVNLRLHDVNKFLPEFSVRR